MMTPELKTTGATASGNGLQDARHHADSETPQLSDIQELRKLLFMNMVQMILFPSHLK